MTARMKLPTMVRRIARASLFLRREGENYVADAKEEADPADRKEWHRRASRMLAAAYDLECIAQQLRNETLTPRRLPDGQRSSIPYCAGSTPAEGAKS